MTDLELTQRITYHPEILGGKPVIRGRRLAVEHVLAMLADGADFEELLAEYDWLEREDLLACLKSASCRVYPSRSSAP